MNAKILLVDNNKFSITLYSALFKKNGFKNFVVTENGVEALDQIKSQKFDLIITEINLPTVDGFELIREIRKIKEYKNIPIIVTTTSAMSGDRRKCLEAGATDYMTKPFSNTKFIDIVKKWKKV